MSRQPCIAIVGLGSIGSRHVGNLLAMGYKNLVGIDLRPLHNEGRLPVIKSMEDLRSWDVTHALICSPPDLHYWHAKYFVDLGIPTFIEKPMTMYAKQARSLCATAHMNRSILAVGYMERAHPVAKEARNFVQSHGCDRAEICCYWRAEEKTYPLDTAKESSHAIDLAFYLLGPGNISNWSFSDDTYEMTIQTLHGDGLACIIRMNMHEWPRRVINLHAQDRAAFSEMYGESREEWDACYREELQAFLDGKPICTGEDGLKVVEILEKL